MMPTKLEPVFLSAQIDRCFTALHDLPYCFANVGDVYRSCPGDFAARLVSRSRAFNSASSDW